MERTRPEHVGAFSLGVDIPNEPGVASVFRSVLASSGPVRFARGNDRSGKPHRRGNDAADHASHRRGL